MYKKRWFFLWFGLLLILILSISFNFKTILRWGLSYSFGVPVSFEVESFGINHVAIRNLRIGRGIEVRSLLVTFYPDALILHRWLESVKARGVKVNIPPLLNDFESKSEKEKKVEVRRKTHFPKFTVKRIDFYALEFIPADSLKISVRSGTFSYISGGSKLEVSNFKFEKGRISSLPEFEVDSALGGLIFNGDTLYINFTSFFKYDTLPFHVKRGEWIVWVHEDTTITDYKVEHFEIEGGVGLKVENAAILWKRVNDLGNLTFSVDNVTLLDSIKISQISGKMSLHSFPDFRIDSLIGKAYGGSFNLSLSSESLKVFRGDVRLKSISFGGLMNVSGRMIFSVNLKDSSFVGGGMVNHLHLNTPEMELRDMDFSLESKDLKRYDFNVIGNLADVFGYYDISRDAGEIAFNLDRPIRGVRYKDFRLYTLSAKGRIRKSKSRFKLYLPEAKFWYIVYDTLRLDSVFVHDFSLDVDLRDIKRAKSEGNMKIFYSQLDTASASLSFSYAPLAFDLSASLKAKSYGSLKLSAHGKFPDSLTISSLNYEKDLLKFNLEGINLSYSDTFSLDIPSNDFLGGRIEAHVRLVKDSSTYRILNGSNLALGGVNLTPALAEFLPFLDILMDAVDADLFLSGDLRDPKMKGNFKVRNLSYGEYSIDSLIGECTLSGDVVGVSGTYIWIGSKTLKIDVGNYYPLNRTLYVSVKAEELPTDDLIPFLLPDSSSLSLELALSGKVDSPKVLGYAYWKAKSLDVNGTLVRRPRIYAFADGDRIILPDLRDSNIAYLGRGKISFHGSVNTEMRIESLKVRLEKAEVQPDPDINAILNGELSISGDLRKEIMIKGDIEADEVNIFKSLESMNASSSPQANSRPIILYDIRFRAPRRVFLNSTLTSQALTGALVEIDAELSADINAQKLSATLSTVNGNLSFLRGKVYIVDKAFNIEKGEILMYGNSSSVSILSSGKLFRTKENGERDSVEVFVSIEGDVNNPEVTIWSQPYMATGDILALILGESSALGVLSRGIKRGLNLSEFSVQRTPTSYQLLFGTYLTPKIYLKSTLSTGGEYNSIRTLYFINPKISIYGDRVQEAQETKYGFGINYRIRF